MTPSGALSGYDDTVAAADSLAFGHEPNLPLREGDVIAGRYRVGRLLGAGGMGLVFEGQHVNLGSWVAIKIVRPQLASDAHIAMRFINEGRGVAALNNPHVARVFDVGQLESGDTFLVMERLTGESLFARLQRAGPLPCHLAALYVLHACLGLSEAHAKGLIHRDIKPEHLFIVEAPNSTPLVKVLDFGISKRLGVGAQARVTNPGDSIGSPCYMSPEQMQNPALVDERTDIWSLGVVLYEALTGKRPFDGETIGQIQWDVLAESPRAMSEHRLGIFPELEAIVDRCLEKNREDRFTSVAEMAEALRLFLQTHFPNEVGPELGTPVPPNRMLAPHTAGGPGSGRAFPAPIEGEAEAPEVKRGALPMAKPVQPNAKWPSPASIESELQSRVPRSRARSALRVAIIAVTSLMVGTVLGLWALGGENGANAVFARLSEDPPMELQPSRVWEPAAPTMVKVGQEGASAAPEREASPDLAAEAGTTTTRGPTDEQSPTATATSSTRRAMPTATKRSQAGAPPSAERQPLKDSEALTRQQKEERYRRWLESENLVPVDEVTVRTSQEPSER